jgi:hypothetical protein
LSSAGFITAAVAAVATISVSAAGVDVVPLGVLEAVAAVVV